MTKKKYYINWFPVNSQVVAGTFGPFRDRRAAEDCIMTLAVRQDVGSTYMRIEADDDSDDDE